MSLKEYKKRRDFKKTTEPKGAGKSRKKKGKLLYMVHDHKARSHHFDLRLEMDGVLKSWAIPKRIDLKRLDERRLAVQTDDHPLDYGKWKGTIPAGSYGAGEVRVWDSGTWEIVDWKPGKKLIFKVRGKKLKGTFVLVHFRPKGKEWLFFRKNTRGREVFSQQVRA